MNNTVPILQKKHLALHLKPLNFSTLLQGAQKKTEWRDQEVFTI